MRYRITYEGVKYGRRNGDRDVVVRDTLTIVTYNGGIMKATEEFFNEVKGKVDDIKWYEVTVVPENGNGEHKSS